MNACRTAILHRSRQGAVAVRGALIARTLSSMPSHAKRLPSQQRTAYLQGNGSQPQWLGNGFEDTAPPPGGGCSAGQ
ncbi:hypothetical protein [Acidovorax sp. Root217]|uniref:hypothetical protein n=1 Tax=Acidovorax sp. Root217 TaxID=1736492 RepID=UPI000B04A7DD|nr:hypothetical protein [Acidovorax sp. Root217]